MKKTIFMALVLLLSFVSPALAADTVLVGDKIAHISVIEGSYPLTYKENQELGSTILAITNRFNLKEVVVIISRDSDYGQILFFNTERSLIYDYMWKEGEKSLAESLLAIRAIFIK